MGILDFPGYREADGRLPVHPAAAELIREALPSLRPPSRMTVDEAAAAYRLVRVGQNWEGWSNATAPYMVEPQRMVTSRRFGVCCFVGPSQSLKTSAMIENPIAHAIMCQPRTVHVVQMDRTAARDFSVEKIDPMLRHSPELSDRLATGKGADNTFDKRFRGGMRLTMGWPVVSQLSSRAIPLVLITDYDRMPEDIEGEGSLIALARNRPRTFGSLGTVVVESSPGRPVLNESWRPSTPHEAPPTTGCLAIYNQGTRGRLYWTCRDCGEKFEPILERLHWPEEHSSPADAGARAWMACPECGACIEARHKGEMNAAAVWLHEADDGGLTEIDGNVRATDTVSWWLHGPAAALAPWSETVTKLLQAREEHARTGDERALQTVMNTSLALPYLPRSMSEDGELEEERLIARAGDYPAGTAPEGTRFITVSVDVQANRFPVQVDAWGVDLERWMIARFDIKDPPEGAPRAGERALDPARYPEDWEALTELATRAWPVGDTGIGLRPVAIAVDSHGALGVTANAYKFWRGRRKVGESRLWRLVRGRGGSNEKRAWTGRLETANRGRRAQNDIMVMNVGTDRLKDEVAASLTREDSGARRYHLSRRLPGEVFAELAAERRGAKGWERRPGFVRNEALDLSVYGLALAICANAERIDWSRPPGWAAPITNNDLAVPMAGATDDNAGAPASKADPAAQAPRRTDRGNRYAGTRGGKWI